MAAAGLTEPRCTSERGLAMGSGRPTQRRITVGGSGKSVARCHRTMLAYCGESANFQYLSGEPVEECLVLLARRRQMTERPISKRGGSGNPEISNLP